jgi:cytochrome c biogenesis protein CcmG, thiol:disulfide interchange protein DsbE
MNRRVLLLGLAVVAPLLGVLVVNRNRDPNNMRSPLINRPAPVFDLTPVEGGPVMSMAALRGRPVVVNFWATWCVPCYQEHQVLLGAARRAGSKVQFLGIVYEDEPERVRAYLSQQGSAYPSLMDVDARTAIAYGVYGVPETYFIDAQGNIVFKKVGPVDEDVMAYGLGLIAPPEAAAEVR